MPRAGMRSGDHKDSKIVATYRDRRTAEVRTAKIFIHITKAYTHKSAAASEPTGPVRERSFSGYRHWGNAAGHHRISACGPRLELSGGDADAVRPGGTLSEPLAGCTPETCNGQAFLLREPT